MKNQSAEQVLNEILLRMNYDSRKTLSENREILLEQGGLSAPSFLPTPQQFRQTFPTTSQPTTSQPTTKPSTDGRPTTTQEIEIFQDWLDRTYGNWFKNGRLNQNVENGYGIFGPNSLRMWNNPDVRKRWESFKSRPQIRSNEPMSYTGPSYVPIPEPESVRKLREKEKLISNLDSEYNQEKIKIDTFCEIPTPYDSGKGGEELKKYITFYNNRMEECRKKYKELDFKYKKTTFTSDELKTIEGGIKIPLDSSVQYFTTSDFDSIENIKNSFYTNLSDASLTYYLKPSNWVPKNQATINQPGYVRKDTPFDKIWEIVKDKPKSFILSPPYNDIIWKRRLIYSEGKTKIPQQYYFKNNKGEYVEYDSNFLWDKNTWEEWGPTFLTVGSIIAAFFPATWPMLLISAGMDIAAAKMQYDQGETLGSKISLLLSLTPFIGKLAIKVPESVTKNLVNKFKNATTEQEVENIVKGLSKTEISVFKSLRELGDLNSEIRKVVQSKPVRDKIDELADKVPGFGKTALKKAGMELSLVGGVLYNQWDNIKKEIEEGQNRIQILNNMFENLANLNIFNDVQKDILKKKVEYVKEKKDQLRKDLDDKLRIVKQKQKELEIQAQREVDEERERNINDFINSFKMIETFVGDTINLIEKEDSIKTNQNDLNYLEKKYD